ncbi:MAG TPA: LysR family transcriptional regulator [Burkholderiaceae bacterium]|nr:LysR family transcriptional regulator [Burkholderiaceae bacterium]
MELRHLRYFVAVAEELHFTRAAERLHIGQPPLSQQIQALEEEIGAQLLERSRRWVRLTEAGKLFLADARRILALSAEAAETARRANRGEAGELRVGFTSSTPFTAVLPNAINMYRKQYPKVTLFLHEMSSMRQVEAIAARKLDLGFVRPPEAEVPKTVALTTLQHDPLLLIAPSNHRLAKKGTVAFNDLTDESFVMFSREAGTGTYHQILRLCREAGFEPKVTQEAREAATIIGLVAAGCGISILPESFKCIRIKGVCYRSMSDSSAMSKLMLARRTDGATPLVDAFFKLAMQATQ